MSALVDEVGTDLFGLRKEQMTEGVELLEETGGSGLYDDGASWSAFANVDALILLESGREKVRAGRAEADPAGTAEIAYRDDVTPEHRLRHEGTIYAIEDVRNVHEADEILELTISKL